MAVFKATENKKEAGSGKFKATQRKSYDSTIVNDWETSNTESINTIKKYYERINNGEYLSADDIKIYRSAIDSYVDSSNRLRGLNKSFGEGYSEDDEKKWTDYVTSLNTNYDELSKFYSNFKSADDYNAWHKKENFIDAYLKDSEKAKTDFEYEDTWLKEADRRKEEFTIKNSADFEDYTQKGAIIKNPSYKDALGWLEAFGYHFGGESINNKVTFMQDENNYQSILMGNDGELANPNLHFMNEDEVKIYNYYLGKGDTKKAEDYLASLNDTLNQRMGGRLAENVQKADLEWVMAINTGLDQYASGVRNIDNFFKGSEADPVSPIQYAGAEIRENIKSDFWKGAWDLGVTLSNQLPSILVGTLTGNIGGLATMGASVLGNSYAEMRNLGYNEWQSRGYASLVTAAELGLQNVLGGISSLGGKKSLSKMAMKAIDSVDNALGRIAAKWAVSMGAEGFEEATQSVLEPIFKSIVTGEFEGIDWGEVAYSGLLGALSAGFLEPVGIVANDMNTTETGKQVMEAGALGNIKSLGKSFTKGSEVNELAGKVNNDTEAYAVGNLAQKVSDNLPKQNVSELVKSLKRKGFSEGKAQANAKWLNEVAEGKPLTAKQIELIENDGDISKTYHDIIANQKSTVNQRVQGFNEAINMLNRGRVNVTTDDHDDEQVNAEAMSSGKVKENIFSYSDDGKTILVNTGEDASIKEISSIKDGVVSVRLENGEEVNAKDISFGSKDEALMYEMVADLGVTPETATAMMDSYNKGKGTISADNFRADGELAYKYGLIGYTKGLANLNLTGDQKLDLFGLGRKQAERNAETINTANKNGIAKGEALKFEGKQTKKNGVVYEGVNPKSIKKDVQKASIIGVEILANSSNLEIHAFESKKDKNGNIVAVINGQTIPAPNGMFRDGNRIYIDINAGDKQQGAMLYTLSHEVGHYIRAWNSKGFKELADFLFENYEGESSVDELIDNEIKLLKAQYKAEGREIPSESKLHDEAYEEVVCNALSKMLADENAYIKLAELKKQNQSLWAKIGEAIKNFLEKLKKAIGIYSKYEPSMRNAAMTKDMATDVYNKLQDMYIKAFVEADANYVKQSNFESNDMVQVDSNSQSVSPKFSLRTWKESEYVKEKEESAKKIAKALNVSIEVAKSYIDDINSVAKLIADDRVRLDYEASPFGSAFVSNSEYGGSFDFTTLCKKRRIYTGTFSEIQKRLLNRALTPGDILKIRNMMIERGIEATCGLCYVEGSRANMGKFAKEFIRLYKRDNPNGWTPNMADVNTPDGVESMRTNHPNAYEQYEYFWNHFGKLKDGDPALFASQQKPKLYESRKEYKGEITNLFKNDSTVEKKNLNGGIRMQSFSDFEIVHMIDTMQIIMDMSTVGLAGQAYTKVPEFAEAFGNTGLKINLSLIAKDVDSKGKLIFDDREGMPHDKAFGLRGKYSENVGTIIVTFTDAQLLAAMSDPRIDFIIPFHRSQWKKGQYTAMGLPKGTKDYTFMQNEKLIKQTYHEYRGKMVKDKASNYMPNEYWDFSKSGKENAEAYLKMCAENNKRPKFYKLLDYKGDGVYALKKDGSTDGYWKLLIDFKMYNNDGVGSPQKGVTPNFSMGEVTRILDDYRGGHASYPIAHDVVDAFVKEYNGDHTEGITAHADTKYSTRETSWRDVDKIQGLEDYSVEEVKDIVRGHIEAIAMDFGEEISIIDIRPYGSRAKGTAKKRSDLDVVVQYEGDIREDDMFNMLNDEDKLVIDGIEVDINPIKADDTGTIEEYLDRVYSYDKYSDNKYSDRDSDGDEILPDFLSFDDLDKWFESLTLEELNELIGDTDTVDTIEELPTKRERRDAYVNKLYEQGDLNKIITKIVQSHPKMAEYFANTKMNNKYNPLWASKGDEFVVMFHGSPNDFNVFDTKKVGKHGAVMGSGIYFTTSLSYAEGYKENDSGRVIATLLNIEKPLSRNKLTITKGQLKTFIEKVVDSTGDDFLSNYGDVNTIGYDKLLDKATNMLFDYNSNDADLIEDIYVISRMDFDEFHNGLTDTLGYDGIIAWNKAEGTQAVVFRSNQAKEIFNFAPTSDPDIRYSTRDLAPTFYSQMGKVVDGMKQEKFAANSVVSMLRGRGVKAEEIRWSGIATFLEGKKSVTKQELMEFIQGSQLQIGEKEIGGADKPQLWDNFYRQMNDVIPYFSAEEIEEMCFDYDGDFSAEKFKTELEGYVDEVGISEYDFDDAIEYAEEMEKALKGGATQWGKYKLDGGENYRELVFTLPNSSYSNQMMRTHWGEDAEGVLIHARIQDFDVNGKNMLFIEEIQSDWHNAGKKKGYESDIDKSKLMTVEATEFLEEDDGWGALYNKETKELVWSLDLYRHNYEGLTNKQLHKKAVDEYNNDKFGYQKLVPDAPFKDTYHEYVLKRLLRMAAEQGYDSIGWTPAEIQSERWSDEYEEGYRIEYDQEMPKFLKKYGRQWGAKVDKTNAPNGEEIWSMDITDSMKDSVLYEGQTMYSVRESFASQVDAVLAGKDTRSTHLQVRKNTPKIFLEVGLEDKPMLITSVHAKTAVGEKLKGKNIHNINVETFKNLPKLLENPAIIMESTKEDSIVAFVNAVDNANIPIMCAINIKGRGYYNSIEVETNLISSVYGKDSNPIGFIERAVKEDRVLYWDKKMSQDLFEIPKLQLPDNLNSLDSNTIIRKAKAFVKSFSENFQKNSLRDPEDVSNRSLLANALESAAQNDIERNKLAQYKEKISLINSEEQKLQEINEQLKELYFTKGKRDAEKIRSLKFEQKQAENRITTYDRQLLTLEASKPLKDVLEREKKLAYKKAEQRGKEALSAYREKKAKDTRELMERYQESRKKATEGRHKTEYRHKIKEVVSKLNQLLIRPTKDKHVKEELRMAVAAALSAINMDTVGAEARIAKLNERIARESDPDMIEELTKTRDRIELQGDNLKDKLTALKDAYEKIKASTDIELKNAYQETVMNTIKNVSEMVGSTPLRDMSLRQLEAVYEMYSMVLHVVRDANKAFKAKKGETITQIAEAVNSEIRKVGKEKFARNPFVEWLRKTGWSLLKPFTAFRTIGSDTFTGLFNELRNGEDVYFTDVNEARNFIQEQYKKHNVKSWDMKQTMTFTAKSGKTFTLTLEQMMSLYAYSRREQAHDHIIEGGIVLEDSVIVKKNKLGMPIKYKVDTKTAFNISEETLDEICNSLTAEQKAYVNQMQAYLSDVMGAKGNEVSMELLGVKLFKEKFYFPLKSSKYYMGFKPEEAGEIKLKNSSFSKETVQHANNPVVLQNFTDVWATHINDMSMYHAFVLPLEDFTRVYNYKTRTAANLETMATEATIANVFGEGATKYIRNFLKSLNGGVRIDGVDIADKAISLTKKGAVLGSASVTIQQPSAIMRAMALINPKHFVTSTHKSINLLKHRQDWEELKTYAPIAGIKEMGGYDIGIGQGTVDWIKDQSTFKDKVDDALGKAPAFMDEITWVSIWNAVKNETASKNKDMVVNSEAFLKKAGDRFTEVISNTQVYDSVFSRSDIMRSANPLAKMLTAFMAEPTTTLNMLVDSFIQGKRTGNFGKFLGQTVGTTGAIVGSIVLNSALKSIITAMRDDDDEETYEEKYIGSFVGNTLDNINPLTYIPFVKDIVSIFKGYDVERMDMALFSDLKKAVDAFDSDSKTEYEKWSGLVGAISSFFGVPIKNVERDIRGAYNTIKSFIHGEKTTNAGIGIAIREGWTGKEISNAQQLYGAYLNNDQEQIKRVEGRFEKESDIEAALRKALRENDSRIRAAAQAVIDGNHDERIRLTREIVAEGHFKQDIVVAAINAELNAIQRKMKENKNN